MPLPHWLYRELKAVTILRYMSQKSKVRWDEVDLKELMSRRMPPDVHTSVLPELVRNAVAVHQRWYSHRVYFLCWWLWMGVCSHLAVFYTGRKSLPYCQVKMSWHTQVAFGYPSKIHSSFCPAREFHHIYNLTHLLLLLLFSCLHTYLKQI